MVICLDSIDVALGSSRISNLLSVTRRNLYRAIQEKRNGKASKGSKEGCTNSDGVNRVVIRMAVSRQTHMDAGAARQRGKTKGPSNKPSAGSSCRWGCRCSRLVPSSQV